MTYAPKRGWTKEKIIARIKERMADRKAYDPVEQTCRYETNDGKRCAVGIFLPEEPATAIDLRFLGDVKSLTRMFPASKKYLPLCVKAMMDMQSVHDNTNTKDDPRPFLVSWVERNVK